MQHDIEYIESVHKEHIHNHGPLQTFQSKEEDIWVLESHWKQSSFTRDVNSIFKNPERLTF